MYSAIELKNLKIKPKINDITLQTLQSYYEQFLNPFIYQYRISLDNETEKNISLRFDEDNFCHLLGIESIAKRTVRRTDIHNYKGIDGWNNIKSGTIDIPHLKSLDLSKFKSVKAKYVYFYLLPQLIKIPCAIKYDKELVNPPTNIDSEIMFYSKYDEAVIHLGLEYNDDKKYHVPRTFFVEKLSDKNPVDKYIRNQQKIEIIVEKKIILL